MENKEVAMNLTLKAMETGLIIPKPVAHCTSNNPYEESVQYSIDQVTKFYRSIYKAVNQGAIQ